MKGIIRKGMLAFAATALASLGLVSAASANPSNITERVIVSEFYPSGAISVDLRQATTVQKVNISIDNVQSMEQLRGTDDHLTGGKGVKFFFGYDKLATQAGTYGIGDHDRLGKDPRAAYTLDIIRDDSHPMRC